MSTMIHEEKVSAVESSLAVTAEGFRRLDYIDGLRGFAALWVALSHYYPGLGPWNNTLIGRALNLFMVCNQRPVMIFLVISGFCLFYPLAKKNPQDPQLSVDYKTYMLRRARRILPPFYAALILCTLLDFVCPAWNSTDIQRQFTWSSLVSHLFLVHNLICSDQFTIDYPMWSIGLEWQLYFLFPVFVYLLRRSKPLIVLVGSLALIFAIRFVHHYLPEGVWFALRLGPLDFAFVFILGMTIALWSVVSRKLPIPKWGIWLVMIGCFYVAFHDYGGGLLWPIATALGTVCVLFLASDEQSIIYRLLNARWLVKLGTFSYSLYLVHAPIFCLVMLCLRHWLHSPFLLLAAWLFVALPIVIGVSYLFFLVFEKPFIGKAKLAIVAAPGSPNGANS